MKVKRTVFIIARLSRLESDIIESALDALCRTDEQNNYNTALAKATRQLRDEWRDAGCKAS